MKSYAFYEAGIEGIRGKAKVLVPLRRVLRRLLRPMLFRLERLLQEMEDETDGKLDQLAQRQDVLDRAIRTTEVYAWDYQALSRRLAALEERLATLEDQGVQIGAVRR